MDIAAKIEKLEADIRVKSNLLSITIEPHISDLIRKSTLREQIKNMEQEVSLLKQMLEG